MDEHLQPFPSSFAGEADLFVAESGEIRYRASEHMHRHDFYELVWVYQGVGTFFSDFQLYPLPEGCLIFISPGQLHDYIVETGFMKLFICGFRPSVLPTVAHHLVHLLPFDDTNRQPTIPTAAAQQAEFVQLFTAALNHFDGRVAGWEPIITAYLQTILTKVAYLLPEAQQTYTAAAPVQLTRAFQQALEKHYRQQRQVQAYAQMLGVTSNYLVKTVRQTTSMTPKQLLQNRLLLEAKRLLVHTPYSISEIGQLLEFPNHTDFSRWFKKLTGESPSDFRGRSPLA